jgi:hypothetical protein
MDGAEEQTKLKWWERLVVALGGYFADANDDAGGATRRAEPGHAFDAAQQPLARTRPGAVAVRGPGYRGDEEESYDDDDGGGGGSGGGWFVGRRRGDGGGLGSGRAGRGTERAAPPCTWVPRRPGRRARRLVGVLVLVLVAAAAVVAAAVAVTTQRSSAPEASRGSAPSSSSSSSFSPTPVPARRRPAPGEGLLDEFRGRLGNVVLVYTTLKAPLLSATSIRTTATQDMTDRLRHTSVGAPPLLRPIRLYRHVKRRDSQGSRTRLRCRPAL